MPKILWLASDRAGCGVYRCFTPALTLEERAGGGFSHEFIFHEQVTSPAAVSLDGIDLIVFQRAVGTVFLDVMKAARVRDIPVVFEMDDDLFNVPRANPASWLWSKKQIRKILLQELEFVDRILVSTPPLRDVLGEQDPAFKEKAVVCWNHVHPEIWGPGVIEAGDRHPKNGMTVIGWQGSVTHDVDFRVVIPALRRILAEFPEVILRLFGSVPMSLQGQIPPQRFQWVNGVKFERYPATLAYLNFDIGIAPVTPSKFNKSKSNIKFLEYSTLGIPCVAARVYPYEITIRPGDTGFIAETEQEWYEQLAALVTSAELRATIGAQAKRAVWSEWGPKRAQAWHDVFTDLLGASRVHLSSLGRNA